MSRGSDRRPSIVFDLGGVLADWSPGRLYEDMIPSPEARAFFFERVCNDAWLQAINLGRPFNDAIRETQKEFPEFEAEIAAYQTQWGAMISGLRDGMSGVVEELLAVGSSLYLFTNHPAETFPISLQRLPLLGKFRGYFVSGAERLAKPDVAAFRAFESRFYPHLRAPVLIDDEHENVAVGASIGWTAILFQNAFRLREVLVSVGLLD